MKSLERLIKTAIVSLGIAAITLGLTKETDARTINVPSEYSTIQAGVNAAVDGDEVIVGPGNYDEYISFNDKSLVLRSEAGPENTFIIPTRQKPTLNYDCSDIINLGKGYNGPSAVQKVEGFTIMPGFVPPDVGIPEICLGVYGVRGTNNNARVEIKGNFFSKLTNGVVLWGGTADVKGNVCFDNHFGIIINNNNCPVSVEYNLVRDNHMGGIISYNSRPLISNNTVIRNGGPYYDVGGGIWDNSFATIKNNIVCSNYYGITVYSTTNEAGCNNVFENQVNFRNRGTPIDAPNATDISLDPQFCDPANNNFKLSDASPCAAENSGSCGLIGAMEMGCLTTPVKTTTWGQLKSIYR